MPAWKNKFSILVHSRFYPWVVWGLAAAFFFIEYFARVAPGVMVDELMRDFSVMGFALGSLSAFFYYAYVAMQLPVGILADRYSPRWLLTTATLITAGGCLVFAYAHSIHTASLGRALMGFGSAFAFVTALKLAASWFPPTRLGLLTGLTQALGMLGAAIGQAPMAYSVAIIGWRSTMMVIALLFIILAMLIGSLVRDHPDPSFHTHAHRLTKLKDVMFGFFAILKNPQTWWNGAFAGLIYAPTGALAELWGVKYFRQTYDLQNTTAALGMGLIFIGWTVGGPIMGWLSDNMGRRKPVMIISAAMSLIFMTMALYLKLPLPILFLVLFLYGVANTGLGVSYAVAAEINPRVLAGTSIAFTNMASVLLAAFFQPFIGWLLDYNWDGKLINGIPAYDTHDFHMAMILLPICLGLAILAATQVKETYCQTK